ncbi:unnamed protein product [Auanema sp. JU1783]|nr:unnamed protein product [Auanema sp. JU1783]
MGNLFSSPVESALHSDPKIIENVQKNMIHESSETMVSVPPVSLEDLKEFDFPKAGCTPLSLIGYDFQVELHLHLDGAVRFETLLDVSKSRGIPIKNDKTGEVATTIDEVKKMLITHTPADLALVLAPFEIFLPVVRGCAHVVERIAYELCEDQHNNGVVYFEGRYAPHLLSGDDLDAAGVIAAVKKGFDRGEKDFGVKARSILCAIRGLDAFTEQIITLASDLKHLGVVGIDVAGSAHGADEQYEPNVVTIFQEAYKLGIHRTVHAGESGGPKEMKRALTDMHAERIGHGYRVMREPDFYRERFVEDKSIHLEACPYSSVMTGAVELDWKHHPVATWAADDVNFSLSRDDPTCFGNTMNSELKLAKESIGLTTHQLWKAQLNAAHACFLPEDEKQQLIEQIKNAEPAQI